VESGRSSFLGAGDFVVQYSPRYVNQIAARHAFQPSTVEKALRLQVLLNDIFRHPFLKDKLVLKGGTAINMFYLPLPRLSVDIDLNYIGELDMERMQAERSEVERALETLAGANGYRVQYGSEEHAGRKFYLNFQSCFGLSDRIELDVNYLLRICFLAPERLTGIRLDEAVPCSANVLQFEELMAGKMKAFIERRAVRDLYDLYMLTRSRRSYDRALWRKITIALASTIARDLRDITPDDVLDLGDTLFEDVLYPTLRAHDRPDKQGMINSVRPLLQEVLDFTDSERDFLDAVMQGEIKADGLFPDDPGLAKRVELNPAVRWKVKNVRQFRASYGEEQGV